MRFSKVTFGLGVLVLSCVACGQSNRREPAVSSSATQKQASGIVGASPNLALSNDLIARCKLEINSVDEAPKFDYDRAELSNEDQTVLQRVATCVTTGPLKGRGLRLIGHTDNRGEPEYNLALGDRRAGAARQYLSHLGVPQYQVAETSRGELDATGRDDSGYRRDRRVDITLQ